MAKSVKKIHHAKKKAHLPMTEYARGFAKYGKGASKPSRSKR